MNAPLRVVERDLHDAADGAIKEDALQNLLDRLVTGKTVHTLTSRDIFDCLMDDVNKPTYSHVLDLLDGILNLNNKFGDDHKIASYELQLKASELMKGFLLGKPEWIEEEAEEIE